MWAKCACEWIERAEHTREQTAWTQRTTQFRRVVAERKRTVDGHIADFDRRLRGAIRGPQVRPCSDHRVTKLSARVEATGQGLGPLHVHHASTGSLRHTNPAGGPTGVANARPLLTQCWTLQPIRQFRVPSLLGEIRRRLARVCPDGHLRSVVDQHPDQFDISVRSGFVQRR